jgi:hypothetical protein
MTTAEYVQEEADADAARYDLDYLAIFGVHFRGSLMPAYVRGVVAGSRDRNGRGASAGDTRLGQRLRTPAAFLRAVMRIA